MVHRGPTRKAVRPEVGSECVALTWLHGWAGGAEEGIASSDRTLLPTGEGRGGRECGDWVSCTSILALLGPGEKRNCSFLRFLVPLARGPVREQNKKETKDSPPGPPLGEGVVRSPSPEEQDPEAPGRPSQGRRLPWRFTAGCTAFLRPAPRCGCCEGCCCDRAGAEVEAAGGRPW